MLFCFPQAFPGKKGEGIVEEKILRFDRVV